MSATAMCPASHHALDTEAISDSAILVITFLIFKYKKNYLVSFFIFVSFFSIFLNSQTQELTKFYQIQFRVWELLAGVIIMILSTNFKIKKIESLEKVTNVLFSNKRKMSNKNIKKILSDKKINEIKNLNLKKRPSEIQPEIYYKIAEFFES